MNLKARVGVGMWVANCQAGVGCYDRRGHDKRLSASGDSSPTTPLLGGKNRNPMT